MLSVQSTYTSEPLAMLPITNLNSLPSDSFLKRRVEVSELLTRRSHIELMGPQTRFLFVQK